MSTVRRYQVRSPSKAWNDKGPDLLRLHDNAAAQVRTLLDSKARFTSRRREDGTWSPWKPLARGDLEDRMALLNDDGVLKIAGADREPAAFVRAQVIGVLQYTGATPHAELVNALMRQAFPETEFAGAFVCKRVGGTGPYSDHAWGDAIDRSYGNTAALFDWSVRMAREAQMPLEMILGARAGKVASATAPTWKVRAGGGDDSHLWHVHASIRQHSGTPPCA